MTYLNQPKRFYVMSGTKDYPRIEAVRTEKSAAVQDVQLLRDICRKRAWWEESNA